MSNPTSNWPETKYLLTRLDAGVLHVTLNRPERRNALSPELLTELLAVFAAAGSIVELRALVLRGSGGTFCAGADIKAMAPAQTSVAPNDAAANTDAKAEIARGNRRFGELCVALQAVPAPVVAVIEGAAMGGGFGLACVSDIALCAHDARFALPETGLGLIPAQIAPFVVQRIGLTQARRLMLTGARFDGATAKQLGLVHEVCDDTAALEAALARVLSEIKRCAPAANAATKRLVLSSLQGELDSVLDAAAQVFAQASIGDEAREGTQAFVQKRLPKWAC